MSSSKQTITVVSVAVIFALGIGVAIGSAMSRKGLWSSGDKNNNAVPVLEDLSDKSMEELGQKLSEVMLPENEFNKLESAIFQAGIGLFMAQSQAAGLTVTDEMQEKLKNVIKEKYNRKYFSDMNAGSMTELSKEDLIQVISFYHTSAGQKFLELSPKIIQKTMSDVQMDLSAWLPKTVEAMVAELKGGDQGEKKPDDDAAAPEEKKDGEKS